MADNSEPQEFDIEKELGPSENQTVDAADFLDSLGEPDEPKREAEPEFEEDIVRARHEEQRPDTGRTYSQEEYNQLKYGLELTERQLQSERNFRAAIEPTQRETEMIQTPWGIPIPRRSEDRPVRIPPEMLRQLGIDPEIAPGLEVLGNVFWNQIATVIPRGTIEAYDQVASRRNMAQERSTAFFNTYSDLRDHVELVSTIERNARTRENLHNLASPDEYPQEIARRSRSVIAKMRGITPEQYERELPTGRGTTLRSVSRARSAGSSTRSGGGASRPRGNDIFSDTVYGS